MSGSWVGSPSLMMEKCCRPAARGSPPCGGGAAIHRQACAAQAAGDPPARRWLSRPILIRARPKRTPAPARLAPGHPGARQDVRIPGRRERSFGMETELFATSTGRRERVIDITGECARFTARASGGRDGLLHVFVPHATAGLALMELGARSDEDLLAVLAELLPPDDRWRHA